MATPSRNKTAPAARRMLLGLVVVAISSTCFVVAHASQGATPPRLYAAVRAVTASVVLLTVAAMTGKLRAPRGTWGWLLVLGVTNTTLALAGMSLSVSLAGAAIPGVLANSQAFLVAPCAALVFGERLTARHVMGFVVGLAGVVLLVPWNDSLGTAKGALIAFGTAGGLATGTLVIKHIGPRLDALTATAWNHVVGALPLFAWSLLVEDWHHVAVTRDAVIGLLFLGLIVSGAMSWLWCELARDGELIALNSLTLLTPVLALGLAVALYRESLHPIAVLGIGAVLSGVAIVGWPEERRRHPPRSCECGRSGHAGAAGSWGGRPVSIPGGRASR